MEGRAFAFILVVGQLLFTGCGRRELQGSAMLVGTWTGIVAATQENVTLSFFVSGGGKARSSAADGSFDFAWERAGDAVRLSMDLPGLGLRRYLGEMLDDGSLVVRLVDDPHNRVIVLKRSHNAEFNRELIERYFSR